MASAAETELAAGRSCTVPVLEDANERTGHAISRRGVAEIKEKRPTTGFLKPSDAHDHYRALSSPRLPAVDYQEDLKAQRRAPCPSVDSAASNLRRT